MPNRYSHALVLSHYEAQGFITLPHRPVTPLPTSPLCSDFDLHFSSSSNAAGTPSLHAVPVLSDTSTTSTASSPHDPAAREPLHSASSSIVTEIYAPQSPVIVAASPLVALAEDRPQEVLPSPPAKQLERQQVPGSAKSRFSSSYDLSSFISRHSSIAGSGSRRLRKLQYLSHARSRSRSPSPLQTS
ncbi:MAG: hypothetical protein Q9223_004082, partial [Gallowayella weberi]